LSLYIWLACMCMHALPSIFLVYAVRNDVRSLFLCFIVSSTTEIYPLSLHDALPISLGLRNRALVELVYSAGLRSAEAVGVDELRSEEHTSELQSPDHLVCRLLLEKKKKEPTQLSIPTLDMMLSYRNNNNTST